MPLCPACREVLTDDDFRRLRNRKLAIVCRVCELRAELDREIAERNRRKERVWEMAREARRAIGDHD